MREGILFGLRILSRYVMLVILSLLFYFFVPGNLLWLQVALNALFVAGLALLVWSESGYVGERAETLRAALEARREGGEAIEPKAAAKAFRPKTAVIGFFIASLPLLIVAILNLASLPAYPQSLDPAYFAVQEEVEELGEQDVPAQFDGEAALPAPAVDSELPGTTSEAAPPALATDSELPGASGEAAPPALATDSELPGASGEAAPPDAAAQAQDELASLPFNPFNAVARIVFVPFLSLYSLLINHLMVLYILFVPLSFFLPAFALAGYLQGPRLRAKKLMAIKKGIRAKKRKERRERRSSGPKPEV
jgi:hypothetical protein